MSKFLLVHGSGHGAWCFEKLVKELQNKNHIAEAIDLPGHGKNKIPIEDVTLQKYSSEILKSLNGPTIVLGHSMGGYPISLAAETDPTFIEHLIYLTAFVPDARVAVIPPIEALAPGSIGKKRPVSLKCVFNCSLVTPG